MMKIVYRWSANRDVQEIKNYYNEISPETSLQVYSDITDTLTVL